MNILHQNLKEFEINDKQINEISKITNLNNLDIINKIIFHYIDRLIDFHAKYRFQIDFARGK